MKLNTEKKPSSSGPFSPRSGPADGNPSPARDQDGRAPQTPARILLAVDEEFNGTSVRKTLQREYSAIIQRTPREAATRPATSGKADLILLCCTRSGPSVELLQRIINANPLVPVIIVTSPAQPAGGASAAASSLERDAGLRPETLLRSVRDALREPRIKRLIRVPGERGTARFAAGNARWLADDLQARYGTPFHYSHQVYSVPIRFESTGAPPPQP